MKPLPGSLRFTYAKAFVVAFCCDAGSFTLAFGDLALDVQRPPTEKACLGASARPLPRVPFHPGDDGLRSTRPSAAVDPVQLLSEPPCSGVAMLVEDAKDRPRNFQCPHCTSMFKLASGMGRHVQRKHGSVALFACV